MGVQFFFIYSNHTVILQISCLRVVHDFFSSAIRWPETLSAYQNTYLDYLENGSTDAPVQMFTVTKIEVIVFSLLITSE